jgi:hypothetical protein
MIRNQHHIRESTASMNKTNNWKEPGIEGVANFWIKNLPGIHEYLAGGIYQHYREFK